MGNENCSRFGSCEWPLLVSSSGKSKKTSRYCKERNDDDAWPFDARFARPEGEQIIVQIIQQRCAETDINQNALRPELRL